VPRTRPLILQVFYTFDAGGAQVRFVQLANHFKNRYAHIVVAMDGRFGAAEKFIPDADVSLRTIPSSKGRMFANRTPFRRVLSEINPDLLVTHNWGTMEWALADIPRLVPHLHIEDGFGPDEAKSQLPRRVWTRRLALRNSVVVLPSRNLHRIARQIWRLPESRLRYIPNGIDCARFEVAPDPVRTGLWRGSGPVVGIVCALRAEKNVARLIRAFALAARDVEARLVIVGEGAERLALETLVEDLQLNDRVTFQGHTADPERLYGGFDVFALSSDTEQMPYTVLEAMAAGRALATTNVGDIRQMVAPENQPFIVPCDDDALAGALVALLTDAPLRRRLGEANRTRARSIYDQEAMFEAYAVLYDRLIGVR
jgi:glycosyltransferase involved in cell wall biosynthesis